MTKFIIITAISGFLALILFSSASYYDGSLRIAIIVAGYILAAFAVGRTVYGITIGIKKKK